MIPECIIDTSVSNNASNSIANNEFPTDSEDPFADEDDNIIEDILSQMPNLSADFVEESIPSSETIARLSGSALNSVRYKICF